MSIDWTHELHDQLDRHWQHHLRPGLDGLTDDEYFWEPVSGCWKFARGVRAPAPIAGYPLAALVLRINRETIHHGAEVLLLRDLYRNRAAMVN